MKKYRAPFIIVMLLLILAVLLIIRNTTSTLRRELKNFAIEDTGSVSKLFLSDKKNNTVLLVRQADGTWQLNNKYTANTDVVNNLLYTMYNIAVRNPVSKSMMNSVIKRMAVLAVKVEVYQMVYRINLFDEIRLFRHEKLTKVFYVGDNTMDNLGTYMIVEGSKEPFVTFIPSFRGFLWTRFIPKEDVWRDYTIFKERLADIRSVRMEFPGYPDSSFVIEKSGNFKYTLTSPVSNEPVRYDTLKLLHYLSSFQNLKFEALINDIDNHRKDSIVSSTPWHIITVTDLNGKSIQMKTFHKKPAYGEYFDDAISEKVIYDRDRLYGFINEKREHSLQTSASNVEERKGDLVLMQFFIFGNILHSFNYFKK